jgi:hypothetical protein
MGDLRSVFVRGDAQSACLPAARRHAEQRARQISAEVRCAATWYARDPLRMPARLFQSTEFAPLEPSARRNLDALIRAFA